MEGWRTCSIGALGEVITGKTPSCKNPEDWGNEILFITPTDYKNYGKYADASVRNLSAIGRDRQKKKILPPFSLLVTCIGSDMGKTVMNRFPAISNQQINAVVVNTKEYCCDYLYYLFKKYEGEFKLLGGDGTALPILNKRDFSDIDFLLPKIKEQQAIADVLSSLDDKIDLLHRQNKTLEALAQTLFRQWFVEEADEGWEEVRLGDYIETNRQSATANYPHEDILYLDTGSLTDGYTENVQKMSFADAPSRARRLVAHNDILISTVRPDQRHYGIIQYPRENFIVSTGFCVISCKNISPFFVYVLLTTKDMTEFLHSIAEGSTSTYPSLKPNDIEDIKFFMPPKNKLENFDAIACSAWGKIYKNHVHIRTLTKLRDTLLPKLMSGEVRVSYE